MVQQVVARRDGSKHLADRPRGSCWSVAPSGVAPMTVELLELVESLFMSCR